MMHRAIAVLPFFLMTFALAGPALAEEQAYTVTPPTAEQAAFYDLDTGFYKKSIMVQNILIATSDNVSDHAVKESAYLFDKMMASIDPGVAQRVRVIRFVPLDNALRERKNLFPVLTPNPARDEPAPARPIECLA